MDRIKSMLNRLTVFWIIFFSIDALANAFVLTLTNVDWPTLNDTKKVVVAAMIIKTWASAMIALFTKTASRLEKGAPIIPDDQTGNTMVIAKQDVPPTPPTSFIPKP